MWMRIAIVLFLGGIWTGCDGDGNEAAPAQAKAEGTEEVKEEGSAAAKGDKGSTGDEAASRLYGKWVEKKEFGGKGCDNLDCAGEDQSPATIEFKKDGTYRQIPDGEGETLTGTWEVVSSKDDSMTISMSMDLSGGKQFKGDDQKIVFKSDDVIEKRNVKNRHGGILHRKK
jgi:hypothetical protein